MAHKLFVLFAAALGLAAEGHTRGKAMTDRELLQGSWQLVSGERQGRAIPDDVVRDVRLEFMGDELATKTKGGTITARFALDSSTNPRSIDLDMSGSVGRGIYILDRDDLKIAHGEVGTPRPSGFEPNSASTILVLKRLPAGRPVQ